MTAADYDWLLGTQGAEQSNGPLRYSSEIARETAAAPCKEGKRFEFNTLPAAVSVAARKGMEQHALRLAMRHGHNDPKTLTNLLSFLSVIRNTTVAGWRGESRVSAR